MGLSKESAKRWVWNGGSVFHCPHCNEIQAGLPSSCSHIKCLDCGVWVKTDESNVKLIWYVDNQH